MSTGKLPSLPDPEELQQELREETEGPLVIDGISYIPSSVLLTGIPKYSFKDNRAFGVLDPRGEAPRAYSTGSELGFYYNDTRYLSTWEITLNGSAPVALSQEIRYGGNTLVVSMTNRDLQSLSGNERIPRDTFLIRRILSLCDDTLYEFIAIRNFDNRAHELQIEQWAGTRFNDIFEVRGYARLRRGRLLSPSEQTEGGFKRASLRYEGLDGVVRSTHIYRYYETEKIRISPNLYGTFSRIEIPAKADAFLRSQVSFDEARANTFLGGSYSDIPLTEFMHKVSKTKSMEYFDSLSIQSDNAILNRAIESAKVDIQTLLTEERGSILYPYAGIPWFSAPFGRDGIITAYQLLPWYPEFAKGVLQYAFETQGTRVDDFTDEQPGKVFHEMRRGEMARTREVPFIPYYGSVDSTPLALILLHEYISWSLDLENLRKWWPQALKALEWIEKWGDSDQDGFLEYMKQSPTGLVNQGWKDSHDSIMHENGVLAAPPIRLCEVQGYAYRARMGMSKLALLIGETELAQKLRLDGLKLKARFQEKFWDPNKKLIHLALDGDREPCAVLSSNMGHCLWSEILTPEHAEHITRHLMSDSMFSGYGVRTLADTEASYNPMSYHNGSIWPHDNSIIMEGFRYYNRGAALERLAHSMIDVLETSRDFRLPELFCGFRRRANEPPIPYEVACKPQAWAAGSIFLMLKSMTGISMDLDQNHLVFHSPMLTSKLHALEIKGLRGRDWEADILLKRSPHGTHVEIIRKSGKVRILTVR